MTSREKGFFYVKNFNISQEEVDRQFALGREFYDLPVEEKLKYHNANALESGDYNGYRPAGFRKSVQRQPWNCRRGSEMLTRNV